MTFPLIDSDVLIDVPRADQLALGLFHALLHEGPITVGVVPCMETIRGCLNREMQQQAERPLKQPELVERDAQISPNADQLVIQCYLSNKEAVQDALIAATALVYDLSLLTKNQRGFQHLSGLNLLPYPTV